jgi:hypothetical protein
MRRVPRSAQQADLGAVRNLNERLLVENTRLLDAAATTSQ